MFRYGSVPEPGATRLATLAATQKSLLALSRLCGYAMPGQEVNSPINNQVRVLNERLQQTRAEYRVPQPRYEAPLPAVMGQ